MRDRIEKKLLEQSGKHPLVRRFDYSEDYGDDKKLHLTLFQSNKGKYVKKSFIYRKTRWNKKTLVDVIGAIVLSEELETFVVESEGTSKKTTLIGEP